MPSAVLSERTRRVLASLVRDYIDSGEPVASATLSRRAGLGVSSATIRNVLAQLEDMGYVSQPHTSAGRVPTDLGYRYYVDMLLDTAARRPATPRSVEARLREQAGDGARSSISCCRARRTSCSSSRTTSASPSPRRTSTPSSSASSSCRCRRSRVLVVTGGARQSRLAEGHRCRPKRFAPSALTQAVQLPQQPSSRACPLDRHAPRPCIARLEQERTLYDQLRAVALTPRPHVARGDHDGRRPRSSSTAPRRSPTAPT